MWDIDTFELELDAQNAALESLLADFGDVANESLMTNGCATEMINNLRARLDACTSDAERSELAINIQNEIDKFNAALNIMKNAAIKFKDDNDKESLVATISPVIANLKKVCNVISCKDIDSNTDSIDDGEIETLHNFLKEAQEMINSDYDAIESYDSLFDDYEYDYDYDIAEEGLGTALKNAKDKVLAWIKGMIEKVKAKFKKEKDPNKKSLWAKFIAFFKKGESEVKSASTPEECQEIKEDLVEKAEELKEEMQEAAATPAATPAPAAQPGNNGRRKSKRYTKNRKGRKNNKGRANESYIDLYDDDFFDDDYAYESYYDESLEIAEEGLKDSLKDLKEKFTNWINGVISKFKKKEAKEKDPNKKSIFAKLCAFLKKIKAKFSKADSAEECQEIKEEAQQEIDKVSDEVSEPVSESYFDYDPYEEAIEAALIEYNDAEDVYYAIYESLFDDYEYDYDYDIAEEGLGTALKNAKDKVLAWIKGMIEKVKAKFKKEKDPNKKSLWAKFISLFKKGESEVKSASTPEECQEIKEDLVEKAEELKEEMQEAAATPAPAAQPGNNGRRPQLNNRRLNKNIKGRRFKKDRANESYYGYDMDFSDDFDDLDLDFI